MARKPVNGRARGRASDERGIREGDVSDDEIDSFHEQRDKILFGDERQSGSKTSRGSEDRFDALDGSRGVLDIDEAGSSSSEDDEEVDVEEEYEEDVAERPRKQSSKKQSQTAMRPSDSSEDDGDDDDQEAQSDDNDIAGGWGANKRAYYNTNDLDDLDSDSEMDEDERRAMELREVKKIQQRSRQGMTDADFGLGSDVQALEGEVGVAAAREQRRKDLDVDERKKTAPDGTQRLETVQQPLNPAELIAKVQRETPETIALAGEYADMVEEMNSVTNRMKSLQDSDPDHPSLGLIHLHHQTLLTYVSTLAFYFYVRASPASTSTTPASRRVPDRAIIERLAKLKAGLTALEDFGLGEEDTDDEEKEEDEDSGLEEGKEEEPVSFLFKPRSMFQDDSSDEGSQSLGSLEDDELMQLDAEEKENVIVPSKKKSKTMAKENKKLKPKQEKKKVTPPPAAPLAALADLVQDDESDEVDDTMAPPSKRRKPSSSLSAAFQDPGAAVDAYGEPTSLGAVDLADKEATRRSLKFHTGQLDSRGSSSRRLEGDLDIPYRDKERSRTAVAAANANKSAKANGVDKSRRRLDEDEFGEEDAQIWRDVMDADGDIGEHHRRAKAGKSREGDDGAEYYDLITNARKSAKQSEKEEYDADRLAQRIAPSNALEEGEHRAIDRTIEKNRGLTPRRPKASRNPRVKKRLRYEKAQKKLSSRGPVYKGGQSALQGGYGGEQSGISSHVVKSRQFA